MYITRKDVRFDTLENSISSHIYRSHGHYRIEFVFITPRPNSHFYACTFPLNYKLFNFYPLENSYEFYYDHVTNKIRLRVAKYHTAPRSISKWIKTKPIYLRDVCCEEHNLIAKRNHKLIKKIKAFGFIATLRPIKADLRANLNVINTLEDCDHILNAESYVKRRFFHWHTKINLRSALIGIAVNYYGLQRKIHKEELRK